MDNKTTSEIQNSITELNSDVLAGTGYISEQITGLREDLAKFRKDVEEASRKEDRLEILRLFQNLATVFTGVILALLATGIIYY